MRFLNKQDLIGKLLLLNTTILDEDRIHGTYDEQEIDIRVKPAEDGYGIEIAEVECDGEEYGFCEWCGSLLPIYELKKECDIGLMCDTCISAFRSVGANPIIEG